MIRFEYKDFQKFENVLRNIKNENFIQNELSKTCSKIQLELYQKILSHFESDNTLPIAGLYDNLQSIKIPKLPKRLPYGKIRKRTGKLKGSFRLEKDTKLRYLISTVSEYFFLQEIGGIIRPKHRNYLSIPLDKDSWYKSPLEFSDTFVYRNLIIQKIGNKYKPIYMLRKSVRIKGAGFVNTTFKEYINSETLQKNENALLNKIIRRLTSGY